MKRKLRVASNHWPRLFSRRLPARDISVLLVTGMNSAAPIFADPLNHVLSDLPFAHSRAGARCHGAICRAFNTPSDEPESSIQTVLLHLITPNRPILLEMEASVLAAGAERLVILTGREVNAELAGMIVTSGSDGTPVGGGAGEDDDERSEAASTVIISELTVEGLDDITSHDDAVAHDDGNHQHPTTAMAMAPLADRGIAQAVDQAYRRRRNYASSSNGSSSMMTPEFASMPATRRSVWYANEAARFQLEQCQWNAADTVQRAWRLHRPVVLYPRSRRLAIMVMRANPGRNGDFEEAWHRIAVFISGAVPM